MTFTRNLKAARKSVRYYCFRSRELQMPGAARVGAFNRATDSADVAAFNRRLDDPLTRDPKIAKMHRLMFSLSQQAWDRCGLESWKPIVREALADFERRQGIRLDWIAAEHLNPYHPHVHVAIKSVYTTEDDRHRRLRLTNRHREELVLAVQGLLRAAMKRHYALRREHLLVERQDRIRSTSFRLNSGRAEWCGVKDWGGLLKEAVAQVERFHGVRFDALISDSRDATTGDLVGEVTIRSLAFTAPGERMPMDTRQVLQELHWAANALVETARLQEQQHRQIARTIHDLTETAIWGLERAAREDEHEYVDPLVHRRKRRPLPPTRGR